jgi:hypothetical protein
MDKINLILQNNNSQRQFMDTSSPKSYFLVLDINLKTINSKMIRKPETNIDSPPILPMLCHSFELSLSKNTSMYVLKNMVRK